MLVTINLIHVVTVKLYIVIFLMYFCVANWHVVLGYNKWSDHVPLPSIVEKSQLLMLVAVSVSIAENRFSAANRNRRLRLLWDG